MKNFHNWYAEDEEDEQLDKLWISVESTEQVCDKDFNTTEYLEGLYELAETQGLYQDLGREIGKLVDKKQLAYGDSTRVCTEVLKVFLQRYKNEDNTYTIPESLLHHIFLQVRILDKQNRIFTNPDADLLNENPYSDLVGYSLLGNHYVSKLDKKNE